MFVCVYSPEGSTGAGPRQRAERTPTPDPWSVPSRALLHPYVATPMALVSVLSVLPLECVFAVEKKARPAFAGIADRLYVLLSFRWLTGSTPSPSFPITPHGCLVPSPDHATEEGVEGGCVHRQRFALPPRWSARHKPHS